MTANQENSITPGGMTEEFEEKRVAAVWLKVSNNGEAEGTKTALKLAEDNTLQPIANFDWSVWTGSSNNGEREGKIKEEHIHQVFQNDRWLPRANAALLLKTIASVGRAAAYDALKWDGRFGHLLVEHPDRDEWLGLKTTGDERHDADNASDQDAT